MIKELQELFDGLNKLCSENEAFYFSEQAYDEYYIVRSYTYRLASWTDFQLPFAKDCRGTAFILDKRTGEWKLFCRAYRKFFNLGEIGPDITKAQFMQDNKAVFSFEKLDGCIDGGSLLRVINKETGEESLQNISYIANNYIDYLVYSYNHETNGYEYTNILNSLISPPSKKWVEIEFENGFTIKCTEDHEFFTTEGYISANKLLDKHLFNSGCSNM